MPNQHSRKTLRHLKMVAAHEDQTQKRRALSKARRRLRQWANKLKKTPFIEQEMKNLEARRARQQERALRKAEYDLRVLQATKGTS